MISAHARDSFERILHKAARTRLARAEHDVCEIVPIGTSHDTRDSADLAARYANVVVLTISSIGFRMLLVLHFDEDETTAAYFCGDAGDKPFREVFLEISNLCCGAINQELLNYFPDLGMSTPYVLSARCVPYLMQLKPNHLASWEITFAGSVRLAATLCVCAHAPLDFHADVAGTQDSSGELEMF
ncbi:hypothetical protein HUS70_19295 [Pandoraea nosoerga]|uniref:Chemotaxis protein CheX n=1 Tax=Pandoraea nosoerga TaxID=2508296 RepID=A0A5E4XRM6_9BURK|nr:hypothetical protein [Pandoraea nosoerga]MBN4667349.1 hypothetical protein [Pandoraea nosoerga]MBN4677336.1 hypothetical protein [Pandoraea nosoerga]MBN4682457.1 hypothetical protein [Pandoraea nosoerga]MBN4746746.1 hypothetical protein [Pandoraea nosoerga]VVE38722.1 hypothetical protein PNO31109_04036 [Pandoraea nosoerga]